MPNFETLQTSPEQVSRGQKTLQILGKIGMSLINPLGAAAEGIYLLTDKIRDARIRQEEAYRADLLRRQELN